MNIQTLTQQQAFVKKVTDDASLLEKACQLLRKAKEGDTMAEFMKLPAYIRNAAGSIVRHEGGAIL